MQSRIVSKRRLLSRAIALGRSVAAALPLAAGAAASAQAPESGLLPWSKVQQIVAEFEAIAPQPPPLQSVLLGTFDAASGAFIWGPEVEFVATESDLPYDDVVHVANTFADHGIEPFEVGIDPYVIGLSSVGLAASSPASSTGGPTALSKPSHGGSKGGALIEPVAPGSAIGSGQRFRGHPLGKGVMQVFTRAAKVAFVVEVVNRSSPTQSSTLTIDGTTVSSTGDTLDAIVPPRTRHEFRVSSGAKSFADRVLVERPALIGYFTLEALPLALIYEPPGGKQCKQTYTSIRRAGTELRSFQSSESTETAPVDTPFSTLMGYVEIANTIGGAAQNVPDARVQAGASVVQGAAGAIQAAFGSIEVSQDIVNEVTDSHTLSIELAEGRETSTAEGLGPGIGDVFHFLVKPTFAWLVAQDRSSGEVFVTTTLLGYQGIASYSARSLREHTMPVPPAAMQDLLLALDPMAAEFAKPKLKLGGMGQRLGGWDPSSPAPGRLVALDAPMEFVSGAAPSFWVSHTLAQQDSHATTRVTTTTTTSQSGFLSYVSKDVPKDGETKLSVSQGSRATSSSSETVEVKVELVVADGTDGLMLELWYDRLFGTFAFRDLSAQAQSQPITGTVGDDSGAPLPGAPVLMRLPDGRSVRTYTDAHGRFEIRPPVKGPAALVIESGGARTKVDWSGERHAGVALSGASAQAATSGGTPGPKKKKGGGSGWPPPTDSVKVSASEGDTAMAIRGKPPHAEARRVAELLTEVEELQRSLHTLALKVSSLEAGAAGDPSHGGGQSGGAGAKESGPGQGFGKPEGPASIQIEPTLKGRMGRLSVHFPEGAKVEGLIEVTREGADKPAARAYRKLDAELLPGMYAVSVSGRLVEGVEVRSGHVTRLRVGVLRVRADSATRIDLFVPGEPRAFFGHYGGVDVGLTPGTIEVQIAGQRETVEIRADEIVDF